MSKSRDISKITDTIREDHVSCDSADFTGNVTAASFTGDGSTLSGTYDSVAVQGQINSTAVTLTGDQTIAGIKTFSDSAVFSGAIIGDGSNLSGVSGTVMYEAVASGTISNGDTVVVNSDGTVSAVSGSSTPAVWGTGIAASTTSRNHAQGTYDANAGKVVIIYPSQNGDSNYPQVVVGTVSGSSISFGTPVAMNSNVTFASYGYAIGYDPTAQKVVIAYFDTSNNSYATAIVGTVSGTTISFGTPTQIAAKNASNYYNDVVYDTTNNKWVISYPSYYETKQFISVGTVSGTSISFGTEVEVTSNGGFQIGALEYVGGGKVVVAWNEGAVGKVRVGTVSGTSISLGTTVTGWQSGVMDYGAISATYDPTSQKVGIFFQETLNTVEEIKGVVGTVSGTTITFGSPTTFPNTDNTSSDLHSVYNTTDNKIVIQYGHTNSTGPAPIRIVEATISGTTLVLSQQSSFTAINAATVSSDIVYDSTNNTYVSVVYSQFTSETYAHVVDTLFTENTNLELYNFIGFSDGDYTNGQTASIGLSGFVSSVQSGLTPAAQYYVGVDGAVTATAYNLGDIAGDTVFAGTALSSTKIQTKE